MAGPTVFPSNLQFVGLANEVTPGTPVAMSATVPVTSFDAVDKPLILPDEALRGSMVDEYDAVVGPIYSELSFAGPCFVDTLGYLLRNILGDYAGTGVSSPFTHNFALLNTAPAQPATHTFTDFDGIAAAHGARQYSSTVLTDLGFAWNPEANLFNYTAKGLAFPSNIAAATPSAAPSAVRVQPSWVMAVGIGGPASGGTQVRNTGEGTFTIKRTAAVRWTSQNSQTPFIIARGKLGAEATLRSIAQDETPLIALLAGTKQQVQFLIQSSASQSVQLNMSQATYRDTPRDHSKELIEWNATLKAEGNSTDAGTSGGQSPCKVTLINSVNLTTY